MPDLKLNTDGVDLSVFKTSTNQSKSIELNTEGVDLSVFKPDSEEKLRADIQAGMSEQPEGRVTSYIPEVVEGGRKLVGSIPATQPDLSINTPQVPKISDSYQSQISTVIPQGTGNQFQSINQPQLEKEIGGAQISSNQPDQFQNEEGFMGTWVGDALQGATGTLYNIAGGAAGVLNMPFRSAMNGMMGGQFSPEERKMITDMAIADNPVTNSIEKVKKGFKENSEFLNKWSDRYQGKDFTDLYKEGDYTGVAGNVFLEGFKSLPYMLTAMAGPLGLAAIGATSMSDKYDKLNEVKNPGLNADPKALKEYMSQASMSEFGKLANSALSGASEAGSELLGSVPMGKWIGGLVSKIGKEPAKKVLQKGLSGWMTKLFEKYGLLVAPVSEGLEEVANTLATNSIDNATGSRVFDDFAKETAIEAGKSFVYGFGGGAYGSAGGGALMLANKLGSKQQPVPGGQLPDSGPQLTVDPKFTAEQQARANIQTILHADGNIQTFTDPQGNEFAVLSETPGGMAVVIDQNGNKTTMAASDIKDRKIQTPDEAFAEQMQLFEQENQPKEQDKFIYNGKTFSVGNILEDGSWEAFEIDANGTPTGAVEVIGQETQQKILGQLEVNPQQEPLLNTIEVGSTKYSFTPGENNSLVSEVYNSADAAEKARADIETVLGSKNDIEIIQTPNPDPMQPDAFTISVTPKVEAAVIAPKERKITPQKFGGTTIDIIENEGFDEVVSSEKVPLEKALPALEKEFKDNPDFELKVEKDKIEIPAENKYRKPTYKEVITSIKIVPKATPEEIQAIKDKETEQANIKHNKVVKMVSGFNGLSDAARRKTNTADIVKASSELGYLIKTNTSGELIVTDNGKQIGLRGKQADAEAIKAHPVYFDYAPEIKETMDYFLDPMSIQDVDFGGIQPLQVKQAILDIQAGKNTVGANDLLDAIENIHNSNVVVFKANNKTGFSGAEIPLYEFKALMNEEVQDKDIFLTDDEANEFMNIGSLKNLTDEQLTEILNRATNENFNEKTASITQPETGTIKEEVSEKSNLETEKVKKVSENSELPIENQIVKAEGNLKSEQKVKSENNNNQNNLPNDNRSRTDNPESRTGKPSGDAGQGRGGSDIPTGVTPVIEPIESGNKPVVLPGRSGEGNKDIGAGKYIEPEVETKEPTKAKGITTISEEDNGDTLIYGTKTNQTRLSIKGYTTDEIQEELNFEKKRSTYAEKQIPELEEYIRTHMIDDSYAAAADNLKMAKKTIEITKVTIPWLEKKLAEKQDTPLTPVKPPEKSQVEQQDNPLPEKKPIFEVLQEKGKTLLNLESEYRGKDVQELVDLKKKLYPNPDIESAMSPEEKLLTKVIADKFSEINAQIAAKRKEKQTPAYGANNKIVTNERAEELRKRLRDKLNNLNAGFDPELLAIGTELAAYHIESGVRKFADFSKRMIEDVGEAIKPYLKSIYNGARDIPGMEEIEPEMTPFDEVRKSDIEQLLKVTEVSADKQGFIESIKSKLGTEKLNIVSIRKIAAENGFTDIKDTTLQEYVELAIIVKAKEIVSQDISQDEKYKQIVELYNLQPTISMRSSERIEKQQYSTPLPMSFMAGEFVNAINPQSLLEPSAGNGMMVFNVDPKIVLANEIDVIRLENLNEQGFKEVTDQDGTTEFDIDPVDAVITNPPFGRSDARDYKGYKISGLDEQMVVNALENLSDNGRASIIIGGHTKYKSNGTLAGEKAFFNYLYNFYNVSDVINMDGVLFSKQGTSFPTRLILINGRRTENNRVYAPLEKNTNTDIVTTFDELQQRVNKASNEKTILQPEIPERNNNGTGTRPRNGGRTSTEGTGTLDFFGEPTGSNQSGNGQAGNAGNANRPKGTTQPNDGDGRNPDIIDGNKGNDGAGIVEGERGVQPKDTSELLNRPDKLAGDKVEVDLTKEKTPYPARSKSQQIGSVVPTNVAQTLADVLSVFKDIDEYVQIKLGYNSKDELFNALAAEQIDSVAMAIYQIENGGALIIGDMTGVGKGRQAAAILRYAHLQGKKPIFVTEKAHLFSDIYRDLRDIGSADLNPFIFNSKSQNSDPTIVDENGTVIYSPLSEAIKRPIFQSGQIPSKYDYAVLTYSQLNAAAGKPSVKKEFFNSIISDNILVLDESHNAGGEGNTGTFMTEAIPSTKGVVFLSGTFAKRADNMPIYALKTAMSETNMSSLELIEGIKTGGVPLQEIMSKNLTQSGQMIRRERDFTGVTIDWKTVEDSGTHFKAYDSTIKVFNDLIQFQREYIDPIIEEKNEELAAMQGGAEHTAGTSDFGINNVPFASKTFNLTRQLLFSLKANNIADEAIAELKAGRRPVIAVANTMEGFMNELGAVGEKISNYDFSTTLMKGLHGLFRFTETDGMGEHENLFLTVDDLPKDAQDRYYEIEDFIKNMSVGISISPIDVIKDRIQKAGYSIGEMTGRSNEMIFNPDGTAQIQKRTNTDKKKITRDFQAGRLDALIMNQSASTGISLHASEKVADQRQRIMISAQTQLDVNTEIQMRGRTDRTGQVVRGAYRYIISPIPAEQRLTMMFKGKLKSLDANTTSSQKSKTNEIEVVDFLNKYGDKICVDHLKEDPELNEKLLDPMKFEGKSEADIETFTAPEGAALKIAGRVALLPINEQQKFYNEISEKYNTLINYLNDTNSNDLEITTLPLRAETKEKVVVVQGKGGDNPFAQDSYREKVEIDVLKKPLKAEEVKKEIEKHTEGLSQVDYKNSLIERLDIYTDALIEAEIQKSNADYNSKEKSRIDKANKIFDKQKVTDPEERQIMLDEYINASQNIHDTGLAVRVDRIRRKADGIRRIFNMFPVGRVVMIPNTSDIGIQTTYSEGVLMGYKIGNKMNPSTITAIFATLDSRRKIEVPLSKSDFLNASYAETMQMRSRITTTLDNWDEKIPTRNRRTGYIITGNILQAFAGNKEGQLIAYTDIDGNIKEGILLPENYKPNEQQMRVQIIQKIGDIRNGAIVKDISGNVTISRQSGGGYSLQVPLSKQSGGMYFLDAGLRDLVISRDFRQMGGRMVGAISENNLEGVLNYMSAKYNTSVNVEIAATVKPREANLTPIPDVKPVQEAPIQKPTPVESTGSKLLPVEEFRHTQTNQQLWNVKINGRSDDYDKFSQIAKKHKPFTASKPWNRYSKGFLFNTKDDAIRFKNEVEGDQEPLFRNVSEIGFYSPTESALESIQQNKGTVEQFKAMLLKNGAKQAEMDWMGWDDHFVDPTEKITKDDIQGWIDQNKIEVKEVTKQQNYNPVISVITKTGIRKFVGDRAGAEEYIKNSGRDDLETITESIINEKDKPKFSQYIEPGGENYKELLLTMPSESRFKIVPHPSGEGFAMQKPDGSYMLAAENTVNPGAVLKWESERMADIGMKTYAKDQFRSSHYDEPNILAHVRFNERTGDNGERVLFIEEFQSDWAQKGKKEGFVDPDSKQTVKELKDEADQTLAKIKANKAKINDSTSDLEFDQIRNENKLLYERHYEISDIINNIENANINRVPSMPFSKTDQWVNLAFRRMMLYAAENGFDRIAWTNGEMQAARYDLSKQVDNINYYKNEDGTFTVYAMKSGGTIFREDSLPESKLEESFGKEVAQKIINGEGYKPEGMKGKRLEGENLAVGGSGMKAFYDAIIPSAANKLGKPFGARVENTTIGTSKEVAEDPYRPGVWQIIQNGGVIGEYKSKEKALQKAGSSITVQSIPVTESMRESVKGGVPLFRIIGETGAGNLDKAEEATTRLDNLKVAREMGQAGKDAKTIRLATGWEKGTDGKWRYEVPDLKNIATLSSLKRKEIEGREYIIDTLDNLVDDPELFKTYPELKDVKIVLYNFDHPKYTSGEFRSKSKDDYFKIGASITLWGVKYSDEKLSESKISTLFHEIQHAIQDYEGFAQGGNEDAISMKDRPDNPKWIKWASEKNQAKIKEYDSIVKSTEYLREREAGNSLFSSEFEPRIDKLDEERTVENREEIGNKVQDIFDEYYKLTAQKFPTLTKADVIEKDLIYHEPPKKVSGRDIYKRLAGEVESRNVQARINFTPEQRRNTLLQETEDVAREDQIILMDGLGVSMIEGQAKEEIKSKLQSLFAKGMNTGKVHVVNTIDEIPEQFRQKAGKRTFGFFDPKTGETYFVTGNIDTVDSAVKTWVHEIGVHRGLRNIIPADMFNELMNKIYTDIGVEEIQSKLPKSYHTLSMAVQAEEYLAFLAEKVVKEKDLTPVEKSIWQKMIEGVKNILNKLFDLNSKFTTKDAEELVKASAQSVYQGKPIMDILQGYKQPQQPANTILINGVSRPTLNSNGKPIANSEEGIRNFWKWFGDSKVVDAESRPLVVYHGTDVDFNEFDLSKTGQGVGGRERALFFSDSSFNAGSYSVMKGGGIKNPESPSIMPVYLNSKNLKVIDIKGKEYKRVILKSKLNDAYKNYYDGVLIKNILDVGGVQDQYAIFYPSQIKSATGNNGSFSPEDNDIRFRTPDEPIMEFLPTAGEQYQEKIRTKRNLSEVKEKVREFIQDRDLPIRRLEELVKKLGGVIKDNMKPYRDMSNSYGRIETLYKEFSNEKMGPIVKTISKIIKSGMPGENILPYMISKHAIERNAYMREKEFNEWDEAAKINLQKWVDVNIDIPQATKERKIQKYNDDAQAKRDELQKKDYSGVKDFDPKKTFENPDELAQNIVNEFEDKVSGELIDELWKNTKSASNNIVDYWKDGQTMDAETAEVTKNRFQYFVPLRGWREGAAKQLAYKKGEGFSASLQRAKGRTSFAANPLAYMQQVAFKAIGEQVDNEVKTSLLNLVAGNYTDELKKYYQLKKAYYVKVQLPDGSFEWEMTMNRPTKEQFDSGDAKTKIYEQYQKLRTPSQAHEHEVYIKRPEGDLVVVMIGEMLPVAQSMNNKNTMYRNVFTGQISDAEFFNKPLGATIGALNNSLKGMYTAYNVVFPLTNFARDMQEASITQFIKGDNGPGVLNNYRHAFPAITRSMIGKEGTGKYDKLLREFREVGGNTGFTHLKTPEQLEKEINRKLNLINRKGTVRGYTVDQFRHVLGTIEAWNQMFEDATRFSVYITSRELGKTPGEAASDAKEASVNFNRKGKASKAFDSIWAFWNVAIQSMQKNFKIAKDHPGRFSMVAGSFLALGFLEAMFNDWGDDDDEYYRISEYVRENYLILPNIPAMIAGNKSDKYLRIPLPQFWRGFKSAGSLVYDVMNGKIDPLSATGKGLSNFLGGLLPIDVKGFIQDGEFSFAPLIPTIVKPVAETLYNRDYMGYTIAKEPFTKEQEKLLANSGLGKDNVSPAIKFLTDFWFRSAGGDNETKFYTESGEIKKVPGYRDINPSVIEHVLEGYTGGTGKFVNDVFKTASQGLSPDKEIDFKNAPFINAFLKKIPEAKWKVISEYYDLKSKGNESAFDPLKRVYFNEEDKTKFSELATSGYYNEYNSIVDAYDKVLTEQMKYMDYKTAEGSETVISTMKEAIDEIKAVKLKYKR